MGSPTEPARSPLAVGLAATLAVTIPRGEHQVDGEHARRGGVDARSLADVRHPRLTREVLHEAPQVFRGIERASRRPHIDPGETALVENLADPLRRRRAVAAVEQRAAAVLDAVLIAKTPEQ